MHAKRLRPGHEHGT